MNRFRTALCLALLLMPFGKCLFAAETEAAITLGHKEYLDSKSLGEKREILIYMPEVPRGVKVPVLVALDGEYLFQTATTIVRHLASSGRLPPMAVVGVVNTNRGRDMNPDFDGGEFAAGDASGRFLAFLSDELVPYLEQRYPVSGYRIMVGISNAGLFSEIALARRREAFQAHVIMSPASGDERLQPLVARALSMPGLGTHFLFLSVGDEEADIAVGTTRLAKTIEENAPPSLTYHYEYFPGETHLSVGLKAMYRALELLGEPDPISPSGAARYFSENQRRERAWERRFGFPYTVSTALTGTPAPLLSVVRPILDCLAESGRDALPALWSSLRGEYASYFRLDPLDLNNLLEYLEAEGRADDAMALRKLPGFPLGTKDGALNNYRDVVDLNSGLASHVVMNGGLRDLADPASQFKVQGAVPVPDRKGRENGAYSFNGKSSFISVTGNAALQANGSLTVSAWIRPLSPTAYAAWISQVRNAGWGSKWRVGFGASPASQWGATTLATRWTDYWTSGDGIPAEKWVHIVSVFDQTLGTLKLYKDGKLTKEFYGLTAWDASKGPLLIGVQRDDGIFYSGDVGEILIYNRTLNAAEVKSLFMAP